MGGFFWRFLAHSQYANIKLIQISDIFGAAGVSFLIAMVNGLLAELLFLIYHIGNNKEDFAINWPVKFAGIIFVIITIAGTYIYGNWRINQSDKFVEQGPIVASVQSNVPQSVKSSGMASEQIFVQLSADASKSCKVQVLV